MAAGPGLAGTLACAVDDHVGGRCCVVWSGRRRRSCSQQAAVLRVREGRGYPAPLSLQLLFVLCRFAGFWCSVQAFGISSPAPFTWLSAFGLAYAVGLVVPGAPGGLGVFETTLLLRLGGAVPEAQLLAVVLSYRLLSTLADVAASTALVADRLVEQRMKRPC